MRDRGGSAAAGVSRQRPGGRGGHPASALLQSGERGKLADRRRSRPRQRRIFRSRTRHRRTPIPQCVEHRRIFLALQMPARIDRFDRICLINRRSSAATIGEHANSVYKRRRNRLARETNGTRIRMDSWATPQCFFQAVESGFQNPAVTASRPGSRSRACLASEIACGPPASGRKRCDGRH
jgi:hypothetical protein